MKSLIRWSTTLGLLGTTLFGSFLTGNLQALALTEQEVMQKLQPVPVFTITDAQGSPLVASVPQQNNQEASVAGVFISRRDAQAFVERLKKENPNLGNQVQVVPVSLGEVYQLDKQNNTQPNGLDFAFIPAEQQVQLAEALMNQNGQQGQRFQGVPLFVARGGENKGYLTIQQNGQQVIPFFFDKGQLQGMIERFKQQQPNLSSTVEIQVVPLEGVIQTLQSENNPQLNSIVLVPSQESIEFLRSLSQQSGGNNRSR
ncbi:MAG TPA: hypothetical protein DDZ80_16770 [Cyanobacteria bacterium UBA8803]|nr:hypothetical protein [Cyanobacteria bacterium UBA9273]HBL60055.1 hypothetical protein [Cyanobacteria bacterium UBA8803]